MEIPSIEKYSSMYVNINASDLASKASSLTSKLNELNSTFSSNSLIDFEWKCNAQATFNEGRASFMQLIEKTLALVTRLEQIAAKIQEFKTLYEEAQQIINEIYRIHSELSQTTFDTQAEADAALNAAIAGHISNLQSKISSMESCISTINSLNGGGE